MFFVIPYTIGTEYEHFALQASRSIQARNLKYVLRGYKDRGSWEQNCGFKADVAVEFHRQNEPFCLLDADAVIRRMPTKLLNMDPSVDFAVRNERGAILSGTLYFSLSPKSEELALMWKAHCKADPKKWDQRVLEDILRHRRPDGLKIEWLPPEYCYICDMDPTWHPSKKPIIEHLQASRKTAGTTPTFIQTNWRQIVEVAYTITTALGVRCGYLEMLLTSERSQDERVMLLTAAIKDLEKRPEVSDVVVKGLEKAKTWIQTSL